MNAIEQIGCDTTKGELNFENQDKTFSVKLDQILICWFFQKNQKQ